MAKPKHTFDEDTVNLIVALYAMGKTDNEVADAIGSPRKTFTDRCKYNGLTATIKRVKGTADAKVEASLYDQAIAGTPSCIFFWLCNRTDQWRSISHVGITFEGNEIAKLTEKEIDALYAQSQK